MNKNIDMLFLITILVSMFLAVLLVEYIKGELGLKVIGSMNQEYFDNRAE